LYRCARDPRASSRFVEVAVVAAIRAAVARWAQDRTLLWALAAGFLLRVVPMLWWIDKPCVRDECTYEEIARAIMDGRGMIGTNGWLWAPAYPSLMALHGMVFGVPGTVQITQLVVAVLSVAMIYELAEGEAGKPAARIAAWMYALSPTLVFYTGTLWSETLYSGLLLGAMLALRWARGGGAERAWLPGTLAGMCVLFRGVATYMLPIFAIALLWGRWRDKSAWAGVIGCFVAAFLTVAPYSAYATQKFGGLVVSDRTMGQMMWLGNNVFDPMTFDWGNGVLSKRAYDGAAATGRDHCPFTKDAIQQDACETAAGVAWIKRHPAEFIERMPMRASQLLAPHSFLTRHLRWGRWRGLPDAVDEALIGLVVAFSFVTMVGGTLGIGARGRGWYAVTAGLVVLYHVGAITILAGLSRYRVPLEPLWMVFAATLLADPAGTWAALRADRRRLVGTLVVTAILLVLMLRYLPASWPAWGTW
jgi:4-amino-4-deoxy-L-arabinose transferase-like glycosyltransferase